MNSIHTTISIIIAAFNCENYIKDAIESALNQTYKNIELVISDDCSSDTTTEIIREYERKYPAIVKGIYHSRNHGVSYNRHNAILHAKGEYITTLDADDYYYDTRKLEREYELIDYYKKKCNTDMLSFSNTVLVSENKDFIRERGTPDSIKEGDIFNKIITRSCEIPRDFLMRKSIYFEVGGYNLSLKMYEDWDLKIRLSRKYQFVYTGIIGTAYRRHTAGLSSAPKTVHIRYIINIYKHNCHMMKKSNINENNRKIIYYLKRLKNNYKKELQFEIKKHFKNKRYLMSFFIILKLIYNVININSFFNFRLAASIAKHKDHFVNS
jgi:glycosyltransferase involved in cell wall biosynthesis